MTKQLLMKQDRAKLDEAARRIRPRKGGGCLLFLTCEVPEMQNEIIAGLEDKLAGDFAVSRRAYGDGEALLGGLPLFEPEKPLLFVFIDYPYASFAAQNDEIQGWNRKLAEGLNVERDLIPKRQLHCVFILPQLVENIMALVAADFYHFRTWSAHFRDDLAVVEKRLLKPKNEDQAKRIALLEKTIYQSRDFVHKANAHMDLARVNMSADDHQLAMEHLQKAKKLYQRKKFEEGVAEAFGQIADLYMEQWKFKTALPFAKRYYSFWKSRNNPDKLCAALNNLARIKYEQCLYKESLSLWEKAREILSDHKDDRSIENKLLSQLQIGQAYFELGQTEKAIASFDSLLSSAGLNILSASFKASCYETMGIYQAHLGEIELARKYGKMAVDLDETKLTAIAFTSTLCGEWEASENWLAACLGKSKDKYDTLRLNKNIAWLSYKRMLYPKAKEQLAQVIELNDELESENSTKIINALQADILRKNGNTAEAQALYLALLGNWGEGPMLQKAEVHRGLGFIYCDRGRLDLAGEQAKVALEIAKRSSYRLSEGETLTLVARIQGLEGQWQEAYETLRIAWEKVRDRDIPLEAQVLEQLGDAALQIGNSRASVWHKKALTLYRNLDLPAAEPLAQRIERQSSQQG